MFDIAIKDGQVYSGDESPKDLNIGIKKDRIDYIGKDNISGHKVINAKGYIVTPGFIDVHTHSDLSSRWKEKEINQNFKVPGKN